VQLHLLAHRRFAPRASFSVVAMRITTPGGGLRTDAEEGLHEPLAALHRRVRPGCDDTVNRFRTGQPATHVELLTDDAPKLAAVDI
jgi:hypothetical protein